MERLSRWSLVNQEDLPKVEAPFFALSIVSDVLEGRRAPLGVDPLSWLCDASTAWDLAKCNHEGVMKRVESAGLLLIREAPFKPIDVKRFPHLSFCRPKEDFHGEIPVPRGAGKWMTINIEYTSLITGVAFAANFLISLGDEGRVFLSDGKDFANTVRTVTQQWVALGEHEQGIARRSVSNRYGEQRKIRQMYVEADDNWQISGQSWHWRPAVANLVYEYKEAHR